LVRILLDPSLESFSIPISVRLPRTSDASEEALADLFDRIENFFKRLESYTEVPPTNAMTDIIVKIMVEVLNIFAIATKEIKQGRTSALLPKTHKCTLIYVQRNSSRSSWGGRTSKMR
jgi:hypothetical protein